VFQEYVMALSARHGIAALAVAFMVGTVAGAMGAFGGDDAAGRSTIQFRPESEENTAATPAKEKKPAKGSFTTEVSKGEDGKIILSGVAEGVKPGSRITVQRKQGGGWSDFPAGTTVDKDGTYSLWIKTSRSGEFRMKDEKSGATSKPVNVKV
jgi:hypothetical protein